MISAPMIKRIFHLESICVTGEDAKVSKVIQIPGSPIAQCSAPSTAPKKTRVRAGRAYMIISSFSLDFQLRGFPDPGEVCLCCNPGDFCFKQLSKIM